MVLTKDELLSTLKKEVRILTHLADKVEPSMVDYRPTPKQRSTLELLRYLTNMGPQLVKAAKSGAFDRETWQAAAKAADARDFAQTVAVLKKQGDEYATLLSDMTDADFRAEITGFDGKPVSKGAFINNLVPESGFLVLKVCVSPGELSHLSDQLRTFWMGPRYDFQNLYQRHAKPTNGTTPKLC